MAVTVAERFAAHVMMRGQAFALLQQIAHRAGCDKCGMPATYEVVGWGQLRCDTHCPGQRDPADPEQLKPGCDSYGGDLRELPGARIVRDLLTVAFPEDAHRRAPLLSR